MTTKIKLENEAKEQKQKLIEELETLEKEHLSYENEDIEENKRNDIWNSYQTKKNLLLDESWKGNWENRENWYNSRIPIKYKNWYSKGDNEDYEKRHALQEALTRKHKEKETKIIESKEYKLLKQKQEEIEEPIISDIHNNLHRKIQDINNDIFFWNRRLRELDDKGTFISLCKRLKENEVYNKKQQHFKELIDGFLKRLE